MGEGGGVSGRSYGNRKGIWGRGGSGANYFTYKVYSCNLLVQYSNIGVA